MGVLNLVYDMLSPSELQWRLFPPSAGVVEQFAIGLKDVFESFGTTSSMIQAGLLALLAIGNNAPSEVPYYGRSPPVYPCRESFSPCHRDSKCSSIHPTNCFPWPQGLLLTLSSRCQWNNQLEMGHCLRPGPRSGLSDDSR